MAELTEFQKEILRENEEKTALLWALRSRILTDEEMDRVRAYGIKLFVTMRLHPDGWDAVSSGTYREDELEKRLNECLRQQFRFRELRDRLKSPIWSGHQPAAMPEPLLSLLDSLPRSRV